MHWTADLVLLKLSKIFESKRESEVSSAVVRD